MGGPCITYKRWLCIQILEILPVPVWMDVLGYYANFWSGIRCEVVGFGHRRRRAPWSNGIFRRQLSVKLTFDPGLGNRQGGTDMYSRSRHSKQAVVNLRSSSGRAGRKNRMVLWSPRKRPMGNFRGREANIDVAGGGGLCRTNSTPWSKGRVVCCWFGGRAWTVPGRSGRSVVGPDVRCEGLLVLAFSASLGKMKSLRSLARLDCRV